MSLKLLLALAVLALAPRLAAASSVDRLIRAAGHAPTESARLAHLRQLAALADHDPALLDAPTRAELAALLPLVAAWAEGRDRALADLASPAPREAHRYLNEFFDAATRNLTPAHPPEPRLDSPLYPLWAFYRARFLAWYFIEHSNARIPERRKFILDETARCFARARAAFPENDLLRIYTGEKLPIPAAELSPPDERAPAWANHQRRALEQLHRIILWWIAERQLPNGEFGGMWGDDVEMWRWWAPILLGFDDPVVNEAQAKLALGNLSRPTLAAGYTSKLTDVEHTCEETTDTLTPMLHALGPDPAWTPRVHKLIKLADRTWWGENANGQLQFKHIDFNHKKLGSDPGRAYDTGYHVRVLLPALLLWQRTGDPALGKPLTRWLRTWAEASLGTDNGKPAGIVPAVLQWPSGRVGSAERGWIGPRLAGDPMEELYSWPGSGPLTMTLALLQAHVQTGEDVFLAPLLQMAELRLAHLRDGDPDGEPLTLAWTAHRLPQVINDPLAKWRQLTGDSRFDDLLRADANGYVRLLLDGSDAALTAQLADLAQTLSHNWPMFTDEVRYTDRVLSFLHVWPPAIATGLKPVDHSLLYSTVTGDPGSTRVYPLNAVRWHTLPRDFAALVTENRSDRFAAELYHFGPSPRKLPVTFHTLAPGTYHWHFAHPDGARIAEGKITLTPDKRRFSFTLPSRTAVRFSVVR